MVNESKSSTVELPSNRFWEEYKAAVEEQERLLKEYEVAFQGCGTNEAKMELFNEYDQKLNSAAEKANKAIENWRKSIMGTPVSD